ncbi:nucleotidyl transferase AbiEii/AbiGii toxin family protein [Levilactobacillus zymae]|uniref:nucleotidyl transferase AbiEii/AbiGii toxin family protein n=1 Tax=Levilactobacillus zymae TaxID=267363 RepID=UPI003FCCB7A4
MTSDRQSEQSVKDQLKNKRNQTGVAYNILVKKFFIDGFLERLAVSKYADKFVWKGVFVLSAITGIQYRTTVDLDTLIQGVMVDVPTLTTIIKSLLAQPLGDNCHYQLIDIQPIQEEKAYQGLRIRLRGKLGQMQDNFHLDVATGEKLVPSAISWEYQPLIGLEKIPIYIYRPERILAEKLQTVLARSIANTRMKDFYDIFAISKFTTIAVDILSTAFITVMAERQTSDLWEVHDLTLTLIKHSQNMQRLWQHYANEHTFVGNLTFSETLEVANRLFIEIDQYRHTH